MEHGLLLFGYAFTLGALAFFAPCCVALLPVYLGFALKPSGVVRASPRRGGAAIAVAGSVPLLAGSVPLLAAGLSSVSPAFGPVGSLLDPGVAVAVTLGGAGLVAFGLAWSGRGEAALRGAAFGVLASAGFLLVFLLLGLPVALLASSLGPHLRWLAVAVGLSVAAIGAFELAGRVLPVRVPAIGADLASPRGYVLFGVAYGVAGIGCTFPLFLAVVGAGLAAGGIVPAAGVFAAYAAGQGAMLTGVTAVAVAAGASAGARARRFAPAASKVGSAAAVVAGLYVAWYFGRVGA